MRKQKHENVKPEKAKTLISFIRAKIIIPILILFLTMLFILSYYTNQSLIEKNIAGLSSITEKVEQHIVSQQSDMEYEYGTFAKIYETLDVTDEAAGAIFSDMLERSRTAKQLLILDTQKEIVTTYPKSSALESDFFKNSTDVIETDEFKIILGNQQNDFVIYLSSRLSPNIILAYTLNLDSLIYSHQDQKYFVQIIGQNGSVIQSNLTEEGSVLPQLFGHKLDSTESTDDLEVNSGEYDGKKVYFHQHYYEKYKWTTIVGSPQKYVLDSLTPTLIIALGFILLLIILFYYITQTIYKETIRPVNALNQYLTDYPSRSFVEFESKILEIRMINEGVKNLDKQLVRIYKDMEEFVSIASHDLQEPLNTISSYLEIIKRDFLSEMKGEGEKYFSYVIDASSTLRKLIRDLMDYSKLTSAPVLNTVNLNTCVSTAIRNLTPRINRKETHFVISELPTVSGNEFELIKVFQNLISNSIKYSSHMVHVVIGYENGCVYITDTGIGFDEKYKDHIFKTFSRLHSSEDYSGTGIGLASVKKIIDKHGWSIDVKSEIDKGTTFYINLKKA